MSKGRFNIKMVVAVVASMAFMLCSACGQQAKKEASPEDVKQAYEAFVQEQKEAEGKDEIFACITTSEDDAQVLLLTDEILEFDNQAAKASVYSYADGQVVKICDIESTSTAYPVGLVEGKYLVTGSHHSVERYLVSGNAATVEKLEGIAMEEEGNYKMTTYTVANDEITNEEEKEVSTTEGDDFANAIYDGWEILEFTKY